MSSNFSIEKYDALFSAVLKLSTVEEARLFFEDICTIKEIEAISQRNRFSGRCGSIQGYRTPCKG